MLRTTLRQMASVSGRVILAIGLTSATVLALAPSAKAEEIIVDNGVFQSVAFVPTRITLGTAATNMSSTSVGALDIVSNAASGYKISATSTNSGKLTSTLATGTVSVNYTLTLVKLGTQVSTPTSAATILALTTPQVVWTSAASEVKAYDAGADIDVKIAADFSADPDTTGPLTSAPAGAYRDIITFTIAAQ